MKKRIALIYGGEGEEHSVSLRGAEALIKLIDREKYEILPVCISKSGNWYTRIDGKEIPTYPVRLCGTSGFLLSGKILSVAAAIPMLHGDFGEDGRIQGALDVAHIPYVGSGVLAGALCADKITTKIIAESLKIPTARWCFSPKGARSAKREAEEQIGYPMFIKPSGLGSSIGASRVVCSEDFIPAYEEAEAAGDGRVLVEELICADYELECGIFESGGVFKASASGRIETDGAFYTYGAKYTDTEALGVKHACPPSKKLKELAEFYALTLCQRIGVKHLSRVDFFVRGEEIFFNEINTFPGMTENSLYPLLCEDMGIKKEKFINILTEDALRK